MALSKRALEILLEIVDSRMGEIGCLERKEAYEALQSCRDELVAEATFDVRLEDLARQASRARSLH